MSDSQNLGNADFTDDHFKLLVRICARYETDHPGQQLSASQYVRESFFNPDTNEHLPDSPFAKFKNSTINSKLKTYYNARNRLATLALLELKL